MTNLVKRFARNEDGATMVEYGLMVALIAVVCIVTVGYIGTNANALFGNVASALKTANSGAGAGGGGTPTTP